jgi:N-acetylneuraminic acid mutarotase
MLIVLSLDLCAYVKAASLPSVPTNIQVTSNDNKIVISWDEVEDCDGYQVEVDGAVIDNSHHTIFEHENLLPITTHRYRVRALNENGNSEWSPIKTKKTTNPRLKQINISKPSKELIQPRYGFGTVTLNNKIYVVGGYGDGYINTIEEYDLVSKRWNIKTTIPSNRLQPSIVAHDNRIYIIGGYNSQEKELNTVDVYNVQEDSWEQLESMPTKRSGSSAVQYNNKIYVIGVYNRKLKALDTVEVYDINEGSWSTIKSMPTKRSQMEAIIYNNKIYVMGGYNGFVLGDIEVYDTVTNTWEQKGQMPIPRYSFNTTLVYNKIMIVGGYNTTPFNTIELYNPDDNQFIFQNTLAKARYASGIAVIDEELYVIGGTNEAVPLDIVEKIYMKKDGAPSNLRIQEVNDYIGLIWDKADDNILYEIEINGVRVKNGFKNTYTKKNISLNKKYYFRVRAITEKGISQWSSYKTYIKYNDKPSAYAYINERIKDEGNYESIDLYIMTKNIDDIYSAEIECEYMTKDIQITGENINQLIYAGENPYQYINQDEETGRIYINLSLLGNKRQTDGLINIYRITLNLRTLDTTKIKINKINLVDSIGHIIDISEIYDLDIPTLY